MLYVHVVNSDIIAKLIKKNKIMGSYLGKVGIVTGGASGIGRATAITFGREKATVVVADVEASREEGMKTVEQIKAVGGNGMFVATDVTKEAEVAALIKITTETYNRLDFAFNNAGIIAADYVADIKEEDFDRIIDVNLKGVWLCMKHEILYMQKHGGGSIVNTSSTAGTTGSPTVGAYVASKHGIEGLIKVAASEYAALKIRVNGIAPGVIITPMNDKLNNMQLKKILEPQPMQWAGEVQDVAEAVVYLSSDKAKYITGTVLLVDGGASANSQSYDADINLSK